MVFTTGSPSALDELISQLLANDPAVQRVSAAAARVAELQMEQARLARAIEHAAGAVETDAQAAQQRAAELASQGLAAAEVRAAELRLRAAELEAESLDSQRAAWAAEASQDAERLESGRAAAAAAAGGLAAALPLVAATAPSPLSGLLSLGGVAASTFLFGVVYRYAVRDNMGSAQLRGGVVAAFGLVRGIAQASEIVGAGSSGLTAPPSVETLGLAAAAMGEAMLVFGFASVALEFAFQRGMVKPLGGGAAER